MHTPLRNVIVIYSKQVAMKIFKNIYIVLHPLNEKIGNVCVMDYDTLLCTQNMVKKLAIT